MFTVPILSQGEASITWKTVLDRQTTGMALFEKVGENWRVTFPVVEINGVGKVGRGSWMELPGELTEKEVGQWCWDRNHTYCPNHTIDNGEEYANIFAKIEYK